VLGRVTARRQSLEDHVGPVQGSTGHLLSGSPTRYVSLNLSRPQSALAGEQHPSTTFDCLHSVHAGCFFRFRDVSAGPPWLLAGNVARAPSSIVSPTAQLGLLRVNCLMQFKPTETEKRCTVPKSVDGGVGPIGFLGPISAWLWLKAVLRGRHA